MVNNEESKALSFLLLSISDSYIAPVINEDNASSVWMKLKKIHGYSSDAQIESLYTSLHTSIMQTTEVVQTYANRFIDIRGKLSAAGESINDKEMIRQFFRGLRREFSVEVSISRHTVKSFEEAVSRMQSHKTRINMLKTAPRAGTVVESNQSIAEKALLAKNVCSHCGRQGQEKENCWHNRQCKAWKKNPGNRQKASERPHAAHAFEQAL